MSERLGPLVPLPSDYLYPDNDELSSKKREEYEKLPDDSARVAKGGKWWSMFDLMKYYHSGILPEHSDTNFINFEIDFTAPELTRANFTDPNLKNEIVNSMTPGLQALSGKLTRLISDMKVSATTNVAAASTSGLLRRGFGADGPQGPQGGKKSKKNKTKKGGEGETIEQLIDPMKLEEECLRDLFRIKLNSRNRIFVTDSKKGTLPLSSTLNLPNAASAITAAENAVPAAASGQLITDNNMPKLLGGKRRRKTRKIQRRYSKKSKTHRK